MLRFAAIVLGLAPILAACGGDDGGPSIAYADFDQALQQAKCTRAARCGQFPDEAACLAFFRVVPDPSIAAAIEADVIHYNGQRAKLCVDATAQQSCDVTEAHAALAVCGEMYAGTVAGGEPCALDAECASATCNLPDECPTTGCCMGTCRPAQDPAKPGAACAKDRDCADGLLCTADHTCQATGATGASCRADRECGDGLACVGGPPITTGTCRALPHAGEACPYQRCADANQRCDATTHVCVAVGAVGAACPNGNECASGLECDPDTLQCRAFPTLGMPCTSQCGGEAFCATDLPRTCVALHDNSVPCDGYNECVSFYCEQGPLFDTCKAPNVCF